MRKSITAGIAALAVTGGVLGGIAIGTPTAATAQEATTATEANTATSGPIRDGIAEALAPLVEDGTITREQADAVTEALNEGMGRLGVRHRSLHHLDAVADVIGIDAEELRDALRDGGTLAEVAEANGVERQVVVDALVAEADERIDAALEDGTIDDERATELRALTDDRVEAAVDGEWGHGRLGRHGFRDGAPGEAPAEDTGA